MKQNILLLCKYEVKQVEDRIRALADAHYIDQCLNGLLRSIQHQSVGYRIDDSMGMGVDSHAELPLLLMWSINIRGLNNYQVPGSVDPLKPEDHPDSDVEHSNSDCNDSDLSEASDSDSVVSFGQVIL